MSNKMFGIGLVIGTVSCVLSFTTCIIMEVVEYEYWVPTSISVIVSVVLAAVAGFACGTGYE